jgi:hypothetical protein
MRCFSLAAVLAAALAASGCTNDVQSQTAALTLSGAAVSQRQVQARWFDTTDSTAMLQASSGVLQDLGFAIDETTPALGMLSGSKSRDAVEVGQVALAFTAALFNVRAPYETTQRIRVSVMTTRTADGHGIIVRTTFQRVIWNSFNRISRMLTITDPQIYQQFYDKLAQSVFLQAHDL